jgi:hypothetical protein
LTIYLDEADRHRGAPAYVELVGRARKAGLAGATVLRGVGGFGASSRVRRQFSVTDDVPVVVIIVDEPSRIESFVSSVEDMGLRGLAVRRPVEVVSHPSRSEPRR